MQKQHTEKSGRFSYLQDCQREGLTPPPPGRYHREKAQYVVSDRGTKIRVTRLSDDAYMVLHGPAASDFRERIRGILDPGCLNWIIRQYDTMFYKSR